MSSTLSVPTPSSASPPPLSPTLSPSAANYSYLANLPPELAIETYNEIEDSKIYVELANNFRAIRANAELLPYHLLMVSVERLFAQPRTNSLNLTYKQLNAIIHGEFYRNLKFWNLLRGFLENANSRSLEKLRLKLLTSNRPRVFSEPETALEALHFPSSLLIEKFLRLRMHDEARSLFTYDKLTPTILNLKIAVGENIKISPEWKQDAFGQFTELIACCTPKQAETYLAQLSGKWDPTKPGPFFFPDILVGDPRNTRPEVIEKNTFNLCERLFSFVFNVDTANYLLRVLPFGNVDYFVCKRWSALSMWSIDAIRLQVQLGRASDFPKYFSWLHEKVNDAYEHERSGFYHGPPLPRVTPFQEAIAGWYQPTLLEGRVDFQEDSLASIIRASISEPEIYENLIERIISASARPLIETTQGKVYPLDLTLSYLTLRQQYYFRAKFPWKRVKALLGSKASEMQLDFYRLERLLEIIQTEDVEAYQRFCRLGMRASDPQNSDLLDDRRIYFKFLLTMGALSLAREALTLIGFSLMRGRRVVAESIDPNMYTGEARLLVERYARIYKDNKLITYGESFPPVDTFLSNNMPTSYMADIVLTMAPLNDFRSSNLAIMVLDEIVRTGSDNLLDIHATQRTDKWPAELFRTALETSVKMVRWFLNHMEDGNGAVWNAQIQLAWLQKASPEVQEVLREYGLRF